VQLTLNAAKQKGAADSRRLGLLWWGNRISAATAKWNGRRRQRRKRDSLSRDDFYLWARWRRAGSFLHMTSLAPRQAVRDVPAGSTTFISADTQAVRAFRPAQPAAWQARSDPSRQKLEAQRIQSPSLLLSRQAVIRVAASARASARTRAARPRVSDNVAQGRRGRQSSVVKKRPDARKKNRHHTTVGYHAN
jgi:hypothetical protein